MQISYILPKFIIVIYYYNNLNEIVKLFVLKINMRLKTYIIFYNKFVNI